MNNNGMTSRYTVRVSSIVLFSLYALLLLGSLNATESNFSKIGLSSIFIVLLFTTLGLIIFIITKKNFLPVQILVFSTILIALIVCIFSIIDNGFGLKDAVNTAQMILCFNLLLYLSFIKVDYSNLKALNISVLVFMFIHFFIWIALGFPRMFASIYNNSNLIGPYMFYTSFFLILGIKYSKFKIIYIFGLFLSVILVLASDTRSILLSIFVAFIVFIFWKLITRNKLIAVISFSVLMILLLMFIFIYPILPYFHFFTPIEQWMLTHTGKSIMSGRNDIWVPLIEMINLKPYIGYGPGAMASELIATDQSPHNLYLNVLMQLGYIGLMAFILLLLIFWLAISEVKNNFIIRLVGSYFIAILIHQSFEITLFQNQLSVGLLQWFILGIGFSIAINSKLKENA